MNRQSSNNNRRVRWRWLLRWKNALNHDYKNKSGRNFRFTKSSFIDFILTDRRSLSGKRPKSAGGKSSGCRFSFSDERSANTKATEYATFYIWLSQNVLRNWWNNSLFWLVRVMRRQQANAKDLLIEELICESHLRSCKLNRTIGCITKLTKVVLFIKMILRKIIVTILILFRRFWANMSPAEIFFGNSVRSLNREEIFGNNFLT